MAFFFISLFFVLKNEVSWMNEVNPSGPLNCNFPVILEYFCIHNSLKKELLMDAQSGSNSSSIPFSSDIK